MLRPEGSRAVPRVQAIEPLGTMGGEIRPLGARLQTGTAAAVGAAPTPVPGTEQAPASAHSR